MLSRRFSKLPIDPAKRAFSRQEGCEILWYTLRAVVDHYITNRKQLAYVFLDLRKAFDSVSHQAMPVAYRRTKISESGISLINELYRDNSIL